MSNGVDRRQVLRGGVILGAAALAPRLWTRAAYAADAGDKVVVGVMGMSRGMSVAGGFAALPGAQVKYVCDVDEARAAQGAAAVAKSGKTSPQTVKDFRRILDDPEVQALVVAAPNHWHAPAAILALLAGKHVYVEKPCSHNPREGELLVEAAGKTGKVVQHGTQRRSYPKLIEGIARVRSGEFGPVRFCRSWYTNSRKSIGKGKEAMPPAGLDYSLWQGPAPDRPYRDNVVHYNWHWFWHWGNGELGNNGVHGLDLCRWGLGVDYPKKVTSSGGRYCFQDDQETPDTHVVNFDFGDKLITWEGRSCLPSAIDGSGFGVAFYGEKATMLTTGGNGYRILDHKGKELEKVEDKAGDAPHFQNFIDAVKGSAKASADASEAHKSTLLCHLGNMAHRLERTLHLELKGDAAAVADKEVNALYWSREYRKGWEPRV